MSIPRVCKAGVVRDAGPDYFVEMIEDYPVPVPKEGELLLKMNKTGICLSDHHFMCGDWRIPLVPGIIAGHEGAGSVAALGPGVDPLVWKVGDRAGLKPIFDVCHACEHCRGGAETLCDHALYAGGQVNGSYAEYVISPARYTTRIPEGLADELAGPIMCSGATAYSAVKTSKCKAGEWIVLPGAGGGVGGMAVQYAKALGIRIIAIDSGEEKRKLCLASGAEHFIDFKTENALERVKAITGGGAHGVVVTAGHPSGYDPSAIMFLRKRGTFVCVGLPPLGTAIAGADPFYIAFMNFTITGSLVGGMQDTDEALAFAARGLIKPQIKVIPFKQLPGGLKDVVASKVAGRLVVDFAA